ALDFVSLASYAHGEDGPATHRLMLGAEHDHYVLVIEDVNLSPLRSGNLGRVYAIPLLIEGIDSSPVTMWME
ncbi:MAG TPA: cyclase family protein, partial [Candidatus Aphodomonas merdavium]|nr:cyclase family protein [Candidatus Aphodomonas merdavium]